MDKDIMISGIKPSGKLTLGNYIGAIKEFIKYQDEYNLFIFIADLHALTIHQNPSELIENTQNLIATYLAAGLDPDKVVIFKQSDIPAHNQLEWVLTCNTFLPDLTKMPQFKNYQENHKGEAIPTGMLMYPSLMNADILLYDAKYVPVGIDQKPHVDLTRDIAEYFNKVYGETFVIPDAILAKQGAKIMSLSNPTKKMSKSESDKGTIYLLDNLEIARKKVMKATTDSEYKIYYDPINKPGISNLLTIYACLKNIQIEEAVKEFKDETNYGVFKTKVADTICAELQTLQDKIDKIKQNNLIDTILSTGKLSAEKIAAKKIDEVYKKIGLR